jgi:hypothetical protein
MPHNVPSMLIVVCFQNVPHPEIQPNFIIRPAESVLSIEHIIHGAKELQRIPAPLIWKYLVSRKTKDVDNSFQFSCAYSNYIWLWPAHCRILKSPNQAIPTQAAERITPCFSPREYAEHSPSRHNGIRGREMALIVWGGENRRLDVRLEMLLSRTECKLAGQ